MRINNNINALNNANNLNRIQKEQSSSLEKLSSGRKINKAKDDAVGLAISEKMLAQINAMSAASSGSYIGSAMIDTAEGGLSQTHENLQRMRDLAVQATNTTFSDTDRAALQGEMTQLTAEVDRIAQTTEFNTQNLLGGGAQFTLQTGANAGQTMEVEIGDMTAAGLGLTDGNGNALDISTADGAAQAIEVIDEAMTQVSSERINLGAAGNRLEFSINNLEQSGRNATASMSRITDTDMAEEMSQEYTKRAILAQAAIALQAQTAKLPENVLKMFQ